MHCLPDPVTCLYSIIYMTTLQGKDVIIPICHTKVGLREVKQFPPASDSRVRQGVEGAREHHPWCFSDSYRAQGVYVYWSFLKPPQLLASLPELGFSKSYQG